jgi:ribonuclease P protein component
MATGKTHRYGFSRAQRLRGKLAFGAVFDANVRQTRGPLKMLARPNELGHSRLGLAVPRHVGTAARRNRIKRLLRESFRLMQHDLPPGQGYDWIIVVRPHEPLQLAEYQKLLSALTVRLHNDWEKRPPRDQTRAS